MPNGKTFWTDDLGSKMWVNDPGSLPPWRNLQTGAFSNTKPSGVKQFTPSGPYTQEEAQIFPYAGQYVSGFPATEGPRAVAPALPPGVGTFDVPIPPAGSATPTIAPAPPGIGEIPELNPDDFYWKYDEVTAGMVPARKGEKGATFSWDWWSQAKEAQSDIAGGFGGGGGATGPTAAELAIEKSKVDAQNLATFVSSTVSALEAEIGVGQLETEQAIGEFNRRLDAFTEAGRQLEAIQPYTLPAGAKYAPGFQPGGIGEKLGITPREAQPVYVNPFAQAAEIVKDTPAITDVGVPSGDKLQEAIALAESFLGG